MRELAWRWNESESAWIYNLKKPDVSLVAAGTAEAPDPGLCDALLKTAAESKCLADKIADHLVNRSIEVIGDQGSIHVRHPERPHVDLIQIEARDLGKSNKILVSFVTGYPDPYFLYQAQLTNGSIDKMVGGFW